MHREGQQAISSLHDSWTVPDGVRLLPGGRLPFACPAFCLRAAKIAYNEDMKILKHSWAWLGYATKFIIPPSTTPSLDEGEQKPGIWITLFRGTALVLILGLIAVALAGCNMTIDAPQTPTVVVSPTLDDTTVARLATPTPTRTTRPTFTRTFTSSPTATPTETSTQTPTETSTQTPTFTAAPSDTATRARTNTPSPTITSRPSATATVTRTAAATVTVLPSPSPSATMTTEPTVTLISVIPSATLSPSATASPTPGIAILQVPSATPRPTHTFTPFPTVTPDLTRTWIADQTGPVMTPTAGGIYTLTPVPSTPSPRPFTVAAPTSSDGVTSDGTFYDPDAPTGGPDALPQPAADQSGPAGPPLPEQDYIVVSYAGQVVPILPLPGGISTGSPLAQGEDFAISSGGAVAAVGSDGELYVNGQRLTVSPSSEFGLHPNLSIGDLSWSPDGRRLAFRVVAANPDEFNGIDGGIWILDPASGRSWQVFRDTYHAAQRHAQRHALSASWAPNGTVLVVSVETGAGRGNVFTPVEHDANIMIDAIPFANATWTPASDGVIVSGLHWDSGVMVVGRVNLDKEWTYTEYLNQHTTGLMMQAALKLHDERIAFLGSQGGSFALYAIQAYAGAQPVRLSSSIPGQIVSAEWNRDRTAVLVTALAGNGQRLWVVRTDGAIRDSTPSSGAPETAHWR